MSIFSGCSSYFRRRPKTASAPPADATKIAQRKKQQDEERELFSKYHAFRTGQPGSSNITGSEQLDTYEPSSQRNK